MTKYVKEHINEKFTADSDPIRDMGIGIKKDYDKFSSMVENPKDPLVFIVYIINNLVYDVERFLKLASIDRIVAVFEYVHNLPEFKKPKEKNNYYWQTAVTNIQRIRNAELKVKLTKCFLENGWPATGLTQSMTKTNKAFDDQNECAK